MNIEKLLKDLKFQISAPEKIDLETASQVAYEYTLKTPADFSVEPYMEASDNKDLEENYDSDDQLWFDQYVDEIKVDLQSKYNKIANASNLGDSFLGYQVSQVSVSGNSHKQLSMTVQIEAYYDIPLKEITAGIEQGLSQVGK